MVNITKAPHKRPTRAPTVVPTPIAMKVVSTLAATQSAKSYVTAIYAGSIGGVVFIVIAITCLVRFCDSSATISSTNITPTQVKLTDSKGVIADAETGNFDISSTRIDDLYSGGQSEIAVRNPSIFQADNKF